MPDVTTAPVLRLAGPGDARALADLEREANLVALRHVFDPAVHDFPYAEVLVRWQTLLADRSVVVRVVDGPGGLAALLAHDHERVRHLAVHPDLWGRGLAGAALGVAEEAIRAGGTTPRLWCLLENGRARGLYEHRGWVPTGRARRSEFAPHPVETELVLGSAAR
jgi:GNAT superfamily N-acetyltransferase